MYNSTSVGGTIIVGQCRAIVRKPISVNDWHLYFTVFSPISEDYYSEGDAMKIMNNFLVPISKILYRVDF